MAADAVWLIRIHSVTAFRLAAQHLPDNPLLENHNRAKHLPDNLQLENHNEFAGLFGAGKTLPQSKDRPKRNNQINYSKEHGCAPTCVVASASAPSKSASAVSTSCVELT